MIQNQAQRQCWQDTYFVLGPEAQKTEGGLWYHKFRLRDGSVAQW